MSNIFHYFSNISFKAFLHSLIIPVTMSSPFPPPAKSNRHLPPCPVAGSACHAPRPPVPPTDHKLQPTAAAAVTAAVAASTSADTRMGWFHHLLPLRRRPPCCVVCRPLASRRPPPPLSSRVVHFPLALPRPLCPPPLIMFHCLPAARKHHHCLVPASC